jgi:hypothetical protein
MQIRRDYQLSLASGNFLMDENFIKFYLIQELVFWRAVLDFRLLPLVIKKLSSLRSFISGVQMKSWAEWALEKLNRLEQCKV